MNVAPVSYSFMHHVDPGLGVDTHMNGRHDAPMQRRKVSWYIMETNTSMSGDHAVLKSSL